jgi:hypothetical protein
MRTTVTLDNDVAQQLEQLTRERRISFKEAINSTLRNGFGRPRRGRPYKLRTFPMGLRPGIDLDRAMHLDAELTDQEIVRKLELRK